MTPCFAGRRLPLAGSGGGISPARARFSFMGAGALDTDCDCDTLEYYGGNRAVETKQGVRQPLDGDLLEILKGRLGAADADDVLVQLGNVSGTPSGSGDSPFTSSGRGDSPFADTVEWPTQPQHATSALPFEFWGGYIGYFGYELRHDTTRQAQLPVQLQIHLQVLCQHATQELAGHLKEGANGQRHQQRNVPMGFWIKADRFIAFDHDEHRAYVLSTADSAGASDWVESTVLKLQELASTHAAKTVANGHVNGRVNGTVKGPLMHDVKHHDVGMKCRTSRSKQRYEQDLREALALIGQGETYEVCLTNQVICRADQSHDSYGSYSSAQSPSGILNEPPLELYCRLRRKNPAPYAAFLFHDPSGQFSAGAFPSGTAFEQQLFTEEQVPPQPAFAVCCSSPERFVRLERGGIIESKPIKGTAPRGKTHQEDVALAKALASCEKAIAENLMIADLVRNDMGRVCEVGSVHVPKLMTIETYATVHQMVTTVRGQLRSGLTALDAVAAAFPPGSMTGAPKIRTMEIIDKLEDHAPRGVYSGSLGFLSRGGQADLNVVIRTGVVTPDGVSVGAGGAVIALSDVEDEYQEMLLKARAVLQALGLDVTAGGLSAAAATDSSAQPDAPLSTAVHSSAQTVTLRAAAVDGIGQAEAAGGSGAAAAELPRAAAAAAAAAQRC
ncbi:ADC synthase [Tribonema minus]|uniref:ADC synthase n=1 Tax=Tribonema minus TaxID=303371 RepID=A0A836CDI0_9STRA|nr:ADC synthase [Tribonema minus]